MTITNITFIPVSIIAKELQVEEWQIAALEKLFKDEATVPFIARYRKEVTGGLDEVAVGRAKELFAQLEELEKRRKAIIGSLTERGILSSELSQAIINAKTMAELEDIYLPFRVKRRTRATIAKEKGLEPLAKMIIQQQESVELELLARQYVNKEKGVLAVSDALKGGADIIAETVSEDMGVRGDLRRLFGKKALIVSSLIKKNEEKGAKFKDYFAWSERAVAAPSHRVLALLRGEKEGVLRLKFRPEAGEAEELIYRRFIRRGCRCREYLIDTMNDAYARLLAPSLENELRGALKESADREAVKVFAENLRELLMSAPLGSKRVLGIDPGIRTGCKIICLNERGDLIHNTVIYPDRKSAEAAEVIKELTEKYTIEAIAIGNGTYGRETESFVRGLGLRGIDVVLVSESGASIYSASE